MNLTTVKEIKLKDGTVIPEKYNGNVHFDDHLCYFDYNGHEVKLKNTNLHRYFYEVTPYPDVEQLEEWVNDGICETVLGNPTEPDGHDEHGAPSWLLALGMI